MTILRDENGRKYRYGECPHCGNESLTPLCDEPGCDKDQTCGTPTPDGYRNTCGEHMPGRKGAALKDYP